MRLDEAQHLGRGLEAWKARLDTRVPPLQSLDEAALSPMARGFYAENRRVAAALNSRAAATVSGPLQE